jgi:chromosome segregation ATPase
MMRRVLIALWLYVVVSFGVICADESFTVRVHPTPVAVGEIVRVALSSPVKMALAQVVFQGTLYDMRALSDQIYSVSLPTTGLLPGQYMGDVKLSLGATELLLPFVVQIALPLSSQSAGVEDSSQVLTLDPVANAALKMTALESDLDRVSLEKEVLQQRVDALLSQPQVSSADRTEVNAMRVSLDAKEKEMTEKSKKLSQEWAVLETQKTALSLTEKRLEDREESVSEKEFQVASQNTALSYKREVLKKWEGSLQTQAVALEDEKNRLKKLSLDMQQRQQAVQDTRRELDAKNSDLTSRLSEMAREEATLREAQSSWEAAKEGERSALSEARRLQLERAAVLQQERMALASEKQRQEAALVSANIAAEAVAKEREGLQQQQESIRAQEDRLLRLYTAFQTQQERFFGMTEQLEQRLLRLEESHEKEKRQREIVSLRLDQLEKINESLMSAPTALTETDTASSSVETGENGKKKTK